MPTSHYLQLNEIIQMVRYIQPSSVLDIGVGFGKYGMLLREYLKFWAPFSDLATRSEVIDGIEIFESYITAGQKYYYDTIHIGNALEVLPGLDNYDLILVIDILEHMNRDDGIKLLTLCRQKAKYTLVSTPIKMNVQGPAFGNEYESHRYQWKASDFAQFPGSVRRKNYRSLIYLIGNNSSNVMSKIKKENFKAFIHFNAPWIPRIAAWVNKYVGLTKTNQ